MNAPVVIQDLSKVYHADRADLAVRAVDSISFAVERGGSVAIIGPSGCGKSSLLNILGCLDRPSGGSYRLEGRNVAELNDDELAALRNRAHRLRVPELQPAAAHDRARRTSSCRCSTPRRKTARPSPARPSPASASPAARATCRRSSPAASASASPSPARW